MAPLYRLGNQDTRHLPKPRYLATNQADWLQKPALSLPPNRCSRIQLESSPQRSYAAASPHPPPCPSHPGTCSWGWGWGLCLACISLNTSRCTRVTAPGEQPGCRQDRAAPVLSYLLIEDAQGLLDVPNILAG